VVVFLALSSGGDRKTCISYLLGLENAVAADFLCMVGLIKIDHNRNEKATVVVKAEWKKFIIEESLSSLIEEVDQTYEQGQMHFFINIEMKERLEHRPIDQFNGRVTKKSWGLPFSSSSETSQKDNASAIKSLWQ